MMLMVSELGCRGEEPQNTLGALLESIFRKVNPEAGKD